MRCRAVWLLAACVVSLALGTYAFLKPVYDWDMLAYAAIQYKKQGLTNEQTHEKIYNELLPSLSKDVQSFLTSEEFDKHSAASVEYFSEQLPFYEIKPLYNGLVEVLCSLGLTPLKAMRVLSGLSYAILTLLTYVALSSRLRFDVSSLFTALICLMPTVMLSFRLLTPDGLSTVLIVGACVLFLLRSNFHLSMILLILSIGFRPDNVVIAVAAAIVFHLFNENKTAWWSAAIYVAASLALYFIIVLGFNGYGWKITFQHSIIDLNKPIHDWKSIPLTITDYFKHFLLSFRKYQLVWLPALFFAALSFVSTKSLLSKNVFDKKLLAIVIVLASAMAIKYLAFPRLDVRYYVPQFVFAMTLIVLALTINTRFEKLQDELRDAR